MALKGPRGTLYDTQSVLQWLQLTPEAAMKLFRDLTPDEEAKFRAWARRNYKPFADIKGVWHPVVQDECRKINMKTNLNLDAPKE